VLGYLNPEALAGGTVPIDALAARQALEDRIARPLGKGLVETAYGVHQVANANMMRILKAVTTQRGRDPRDFVLFAFGGSGGVHAVSLARALQIRRVVVPPAAGVFSALGLLFADLQLNESRSFLGPLHDLPRAAAEAVYEQLEDEITKRLGQPRDEIRFQRFADLRYAGQAFELTVPAPDGDLGDGALAELGRRFDAAHKRRYGHDFGGQYSIDVVNLRLDGTVATEVVRRIARAAQPARAEGRRSAYFGPDAGERCAAVIERAHLTEAPRQGPLVIEEYEGTTVVPPDAAARVDEHGNILIDVGKVE